MQVICDLIGLSFYYPLVLISYAKALIFMAIVIALVYDKREYFEKILEWVELLDPVRLHYESRNFFSIGKYAISHRYIYKTKTI